MAFLLRFAILFALLANLTTAQDRTLEQVTAELRAANENLAAQKMALDANTRAHVALSREAATISNAIQAINQEIEALALELDEISEPPIIVDPPPPNTGLEPPPDFSQAPFASLIPTFPQYHIPTLEDCEWTISGGVATSTRGLPSIPFDAENDVCGWAYRASIAAGHELPITFGVYDDAGDAAVGGFYWHTSGRSITVSDGAGGWRPLEVEFVGLSDSAEVSLQWCGQTGGQEWGRTEYVGAYNIGLRGVPSHFGINANKPHGKAILDGCWFMGPRGSENTHFYNAAATFAHGHTLVVRRTKMRGKTPNDPYARYREHNFYFKNAGPGGIWILENHFQGSNGTCFQIRPGTDEPLPVKPNGPVVVAYNHSNGYGWEWGNTAATAHGGSALTIWCVPDFPTFVYRNRIIDARYGCLVVSQQGSVPENYGTPTAPVGSDRNFYGNDGFPVSDVFVADNEFSNPRSARKPVSISGCKSVHIWSDNILHNGWWELNGQWAAQNGYTDIQIGAIRLYGPPMQGENFYTFKQGVLRPMTQAELLPLRVPAGTPVIWE